MNYIQMFADGGKTSDQELIKGIQKILGVDDEQMEQLLQIGINKYGSLEGIGQALNQATQGLTQNSSPEEVQSAVASVFQTNAESQMFKCGGKLQQLVSKFGKGGPVDCGCGGVKLNQSGGVTDGKPFQNLPSSIYNENGIFLGNDNEQQVWDYINSRQNPRTWTTTHPSIQARLNNTVNQSRMMWNSQTLPENFYDVSTFTRLPDGSVSTLYQKPSINKSNNVETKQEGGQMKRKNAINAIMAGNNYENRAQARFAYRNLRNAGMGNADIVANMAKTPVLDENFTISELPIEVSDTTISLTPDNLQVTKMNVPRRGSSQSKSSNKGSIDVGPLTVNTPTESSKTTILPLWGQMPFISKEFPDQKTNEQVNQENLNRKAGEYERYMSTTGADEDVRAWGFDPNFKNIDRTSEAYRQGQRQAAKNAATTTVAGTVAALGIPVAINYAPTAGRFVVNTLKPSPRLLTAEQVQAGWNGGLGAMRDGLLLHKCGGKVKSKEGVKLAKCGKKIKKHQSGAIIEPYYNTSPIINKLKQLINDSSVLYGTSRESDHSIRQTVPDFNNIPIRTVIANNPYIVKGIQKPESKLNVKNKPKDFGRLIDKSQTIQHIDNLIK